MPFEARRILSALTKALGQLHDPVLRKPLLLGFGIALVTFAGLWGSAAYLLAHLNLSHIFWLRALLAWTGDVAAFVLALLLFPSLMIAASTFFLGWTVDAVERRFFPGIGGPRKAGLVESMAQSLKLSALSLVVNIACLPFYFFPGAGLIAFLLLNGLLIGREYFELVALRRKDPAASAEMRLRHRAPILATGVLFAWMSLVPILNLLMPILAAATFTHLFHGWKDNEI